jgi:hypothetical protein
MDPNAWALARETPQIPLADLVRARPRGTDQKVLHDQILGRLHPNTCRVCRQELAYAKDVGRFPLEEENVQVAYLAGRGYRYLLSAWWSRVATHLPLEIREMPAVSSYYRHMSFHLGLKTEREAPRVTPVPLRDGAWTQLPPEERVKQLRRDQGKLEKSVVRMARAMVELEALARQSLEPSHPLLPALEGNRRLAERCLGRLEPSGADLGTTGGFATKTPTPPGRLRKRDDIPT